MFRPEELDRELIKMVPDHINIFKYQKIVFSDSKKLDEYIKLRNEYHRLVLNDIEDQEGLCCLLEEEIIKLFDPEFAAKLSFSYSTRDDIYGRGYRKLKNFLKKFQKIDDVILFLQNKKVEGCEK